MLTSYFANVKNLKYPIAISRGVPTWFKGLCYQDLAPSWRLVLTYKEMKAKAETLHTSTKECENFYINEYNKQLSQLNVDKVYIDLCKLYKGVNPNEISLLCFEKPTDFCHRHLVADWLKNASYNCYEIRPGIKQN